MLGVMVGGADATAGASNVEMLLLGAVVPLIVGLVSAAVGGYWTRRSEHDKWCRQERLQAWSEIGGCSAQARMWTKLDPEDDNSDLDEVSVRFSEAVAAALLIGPAELDARAFALKDAYNEYIDALNDEAESAMLTAKGEVLATQTREALLRVRSLLKAS